MRLWHRWLCYECLTYSWRTPWPHAREQCNSCKGECFNMEVLGLTTEALHATYLLAGQEGVQLMIKAAYDAFSLTPPSTDDPVGPV